MCQKPFNEKCRFIFAIILVLSGFCAAIDSPVLKWQYGGCYSTWCETGWYSSPAVADLDSDGTMEVIAAAYTVFIVNGEDGSLQDSYDPPGDRCWPGVVVSDIDSNGDLEIITAHAGGYLNVYDNDATLVWSEQPETSELRGLSVFDLDNDGTMEIVVTATGGRVNTWVYEHDGTLRSGWPQLDTEAPGYSWGVYNDNAAIGDLDGDSIAEIVVPSDGGFICAYDPNGSPLQANEIYGNKKWGEVQAWLSLAIEIQGWGSCSPPADHRSDFPDSPAVISDVDGNGVFEVAVVGRVYSCDDYVSRYRAVYLFNADRSRFNTGAFNWETVPVDMGAPLVEDWTVMERALPNPVTADLDSDGTKEIIYSSYDGKVHAFWLDKTEHGNWPYSVYDAGEGFYRFASEPVVADLDNDGYAEVIFSSWVERGTHEFGKLHILDYLGNVVHEVDLPGPLGSADWGGGMGAPTIANIDGDADFEVLINTVSSGVVAYDLPGTAYAKVLWGTGRGSYHRTGMSMVEMKSCGDMWRKLGDFDGDCDIDHFDLNTLASQAFK